MIACTMHAVSTADKLWTLFFIFIFFAGGLGLGASIERTFGEKS